MMLATWGAVVYAGMVAAALPYFESCGFAFPQESGYSLPDWLVDTTSGATGVVMEDEAATDSAHAVDFASLWENSNWSRAYNKAHNNAIEALKAKPVDLHSVAMKGPGQLKALRTLFSYRMLSH